MAVSLSQQEADAYRECRDLARRHYENFPVISVILPAGLRLPISAIYAFARSADDIADEGELDADTRLAGLARYDQQLDRISAGQTLEEPVFIALAHTIRQHQLPVSLFHDLIHAFRQDVTKIRYATLDEIWLYCRYSANPVGRLLLHLYGADTEQNRHDSDDICSALQLINFLQDIAQDLEENNRLYLPQDLMSRFGVSEMQLRHRENNPALQGLVRHLIGVSRQRMQRGYRLGRNLPGRFGFQSRIMFNGGLCILDRLEQSSDAFARPRLRQRDWLRMILRAI